MEKDKVIIEYVGNNKVSVSLYDEENKCITIPGIDLLLKKEAYKKYDIVGEEINGKIRTSDDDDFEEEDYEEFFDGDWNEE